MKKIIGFVLLASLSFTGIYAKNLQLMQSNIQNTQEENSSSQKNSTDSNTLLKQYREQG
ncbi:endoglucanase [Allofrancisella guangzhouensis]|uniref:endoglucanase n=1 Tax=Allofrancisella guangzhouensis TaxID=594679 RepID=UPI000A56614C|nr:endoglucanase [Allofrancisella guangzhouensis]MBK2026951.1 endoglucanase [Allofrancisella guangzhouensis]MBK2044233.1 endoglucanase [Allofrancisella guangzhouensis]MBK2045161.1 endoglucanase [Allofrancisella guangzhouensis]